MSRLETLLLRILHDYPEKKTSGETLSGPSTMQKQFPSAFLFLSSPRKDGKFFIYWAKAAVVAQLTQAFWQSWKNAPPKKCVPFAWNSFNKAREHKNLGFFQFNCQLYIHLFASFIE